MLSANVGASVSWYLHFIVNCITLYKQMTWKITNFKEEFQSFSIQNREHVHAHTQE